MRNNFLTKKTISKSIKFNNNHYNKNIDIKITYTKKNNKKKNKFF